MTIEEISRKTMENKGSLEVRREIGEEIFSLVKEKVVVLHMILGPGDDKRRSLICYGSSPKAS